MSLVRDNLITIYFKTCLHICLRKLNTSILFASLIWLILSCKRKRHMLRITPITGFSFKTKYSERKETALTKERRWNSGFIKKTDKHKHTYLLKKITGLFSAFHRHYIIRKFYKISCNKKYSKYLF